MAGLMDVDLAGWLAVKKNWIRGTFVGLFIYAVGGASSAGKAHPLNRPFLSVEFQMDPSYKDVFVRCVSNQ